ncbi:MAG: erythromycin esterase family protein [Steroidobacteraceae bacterium]
MVFAHDGHVMNAHGRGGIWRVYKEPPLMMGAHLRTQLGRELRIIVTLAAHSEGGLPAGHPIPDSVEVSLESLRRSFFALDLHGARGNEGAMAWLDERRPIRQNFDTELDVVPARAFDVVVFTNTVTRAITNGARP